MSDSLKNDVLIKDGMDKLYALVQDENDDYIRAGDYALLIGFYESLILRYIDESKKDDFLADLEAATRFFRK